MPVSKNDLVKSGVKLVLDTAPVEIASKILTTGEKLETIMQHLQGFNLEKIVVGHCTGNDAIQALYTRFKGKIILNAVGNVINF